VRQKTFAASEGELYRYAAVDPPAFRRAVDAVLGAGSATLSGEARHLPIHDGPTAGEIFTRAKMPKQSPISNEPLAHRLRLVESV
jgi:hypothetical protein